MPIQGGGGPSALPPNGAAGGDLAGSTYPNPAVSNVSILTTKGDILSETSNGVAARLPIGATGNVLTVAAGLASWAAPAAGGVSSFNTRTGAVTAATADYYGIVAAALTGVTGGAARFVGSLAVGAAPASGTFLTGDFTVNQDGSVWVCTAGGTQGTWVNAATLIPAGTITNAMVNSSAAIAISKLADPGAGQVIGSNSGAAAVFPPGYEIGYDQITASVAITSTTESAGTTVITCGAHTFDGSPVMVEFYSPQILASSSGFLVVSLFESTTQITELGGLFLAALNISACMRYRFTPSAASHTYKITAHVNANVGGPTIVAGAGGTGAKSPAFVRFTKV